MRHLKGGIWIQGAGELASGVAWRLFRCGFPVVMAEVAAPLAVRRLVCFAEAVYAGQARVEGVMGLLVTSEDAVFSREAVTVMVDPEGQQLRRLRPAVIVDARMTKRAPRPLPAPATPVIGLGPGFRCGRDAVFVVETHRGARLGSLLREGEAAADTGIPGPVGGQTSRRLLRAPAAGRLRPLCRIGELVKAGQTVAFVGSEPLNSSIDGLLRGLVHPEVELSTGDKVGDVDPRGAVVDPRLVSDKSLAVAGGVLEGVLGLGIWPRP